MPSPIFASHTAAATGGKPMHDDDDIYRAARDVPPFSNGTEAEAWMETWCGTCAHDSPAMVEQGEGCPLVLVALAERTPAEWVDEDPRSLTYRYRCTEYQYRDDDEDGGDGWRPVDTVTVTEGRL
jgi:hypothetical protein